jgi:p-cumate 2,3-dioxygenase beta subunit
MAGAQAAQEVTRQNVEDFLYLEAALLDGWQLDDWFALLSEGATFEIPTTDWAGWDGLSGGFFTLDDYDLIKARVKRLKSRKAHAENPHSRTHRMISNVRILSATDDQVEISAAFLIHRFRDGTTNSYAGFYQHLLDVTDVGLRIRRRRSVLSPEALTAGARLSFIL